MSALIMFVSIGGYIVLTNFADSISPLKGIITTKGGPPPAADGGQTFLLVGSDSRANLSRAERRLYKTGQDVGRRSDTTIVVHIPGDRKDPVLVSLPRDSLVEIPAYVDTKGRRHAAHTDKLNAAFSLGGPKLTVQTVQMATGLRIDHYLEVDFRGFIDIVDAVGGVPICTTKTLDDRGAQRSGLYLTAGRHNLKGKDALGYVRARHIYANGDLGRIEAQQKFIGGMVRKVTDAKTLLNPFKVKKLMNATAGSLRRDDGLGAKDLANLAVSLRNTSPSRVTFATVPVADVSYRYRGQSVVLWDREAAAALFRKIHKGDPIDDARDNTTLQPSQVSVRVVNASGVSGLAGRTASKLATGGYKRGGEPTTAAQQTQQTLVRYSGEDGAAKTLLKAYPDAQLKQVDGLGSVVELVIGTDFDYDKVTVTKPAPRPSGAPTTRTAADVDC
jgi:LCP family protein required for cell wall assembly